MSVAYSEGMKHAIPVSLVLSLLLAGCGADDYGSSGGGKPQGVPANEGDNYEAVGTNPFTLTSHDPLSTFAADVDTASYDLFVRDLETGVLPKPESVRLEEYVNFFHYDYAAPAADAADPFAVFLDAAPSVLNDTTILRIGMQAVQPPPEEKRPANLVFLIDISGSMTSSNKLPLVKQVLLQTLDLLDPTDTVSIVTYAGATGVALLPTPVSNRAEIESVINSFQAGGSTAGGAGINLAYQQAESAFLEDGINHVLLCSDGDFNVGLASTEELVALIEEKRTSGITLTVLGFGSGNLNDAMMEKISNKGNGIYGVISSEKTAAQYVEERMLSSFNLIAKDVKLQVEFNPEQVLAYRLLGYENRAIDDSDFRDDGVDAGEIGAGHQVTALYELVLTGKPIPAPEGAPAIVDGAPYDGTVEIDAADMAMVKIRYKQPSARAEDAAKEVSTSIATSDIVPFIESADPDLAWAVSIAAFAEILKGSPYADKEALDTISDIVAADTTTDGYRTEFAGYLAVAKPMLVP